MLITWLLMTKAGRRVPMTSKRRLKGVLALKKLLQKRAKHLLMSAVSIFNVRMIPFHLNCPMIPWKSFLPSLLLNTVPQLSCFFVLWLECESWLREWKNTADDPQCRKFLLQKNSGLCQPQPLFQPGHLRSLKRSLCGIVVFRVFCSGLAQRFKIGA